MRSALLPAALSAFVPLHGAATAGAYAAPDTAEERIEVCFQHACARQAAVDLEAALLESIARQFTESTNAVQERAAISSSVAALEQVVGRDTGTDRDLGGTFAGAFRPGQMDCIDESTNTTRYLQLFAEHGWLRWHSVGRPATRLPLPVGWWPHTTAVIRERASGDEFAVDSWFEPNGRPPHIVDLPRWRRGWKPQAQTP